MRFLLFPLLTLAAAVSASAQTPMPHPIVVPEEGTITFPVGLPQIPKPGRYVGVLTITKDFIGEGLSSKVTMRASANVKNSGEMAILAVVPESPKVAADNPESTLSRALPGNFSYIIDGKHQAALSLSGGGFQLSYTSPADLPLAVLNSPNATSTIPTDGAVTASFPVVTLFPPAITRIHYRFTPEPARRPGARGAR